VLYRPPRPLVKAAGRIVRLQADDELDLNLPASASEAVSDSQMTSLRIVKSRRSSHVKSRSMSLLSALPKG
jgi:hypothetical protein